MTTSTQIERRIRALTERRGFCLEHGQDTAAIDDEIAELRAQLRGVGGHEGAEKRGDTPTTPRSPA